MRIRFRYLIVVILLVAIGAFCCKDERKVEATEQRYYYIDFDAGSDSNTGMTPDAPWKHCPGDRNAEAIPAAYVPKPGDVFQFKGGVTYRGTVRGISNGTVAEPVTYLGTGYGEGQAIIDGAERVDSLWKRCTSASECGGNDNYANIWYTDTKMEPAESYLSKEYSVNLHQENEYLFVAQWPRLTDQFYYDNIRQFAESVGGLTPTTATHPELESIGGAQLVGRTVHVHNANNAVSPRIIAAYSNNTITFDEPINPNGYKHFAVANFEGLIYEPGQYTYGAADERGYHRIYLWPRENVNPNNTNIFLSTRECGIHMRDLNNIIIDGFHVIRNAATDNAKGSGIRANNCDNVIIRNNLVEHIRQSDTNYGAIDGSLTNSLIENNTVRDNARRKGIFLCVSDHVIVRNNLVENNGGTAICGFDTKNTQIIYNTVVDNHGSHGNGMSFYLGCDNILIASNIVRNSNMLLTFETSSNYYVYNNFFDGAGKINYLMNNRGTTGKFYFINNTCVNSSKNAAILIQNGEIDSEVIFKNNIVDGAAVGIPAHQDPSTARTHNLYVGNVSKAPYRINEGEIIDQTFKDLAAYQEELVFIDPVIGAGDYHLLSASPARDNGTDVSSYLPKDLFPEFDFDVDIEGHPRVVGGAWDMGAFEYQGPDSVKPAYFSLHTTTERALVGNEIEIELHASELLDTLGEGDYEAVIQFNREYFARYAGYEVIDNTGIVVDRCYEMNKETGDWETEGIYYYGKVSIHFTRNMSQTLKPGAFIRLKFRLLDNETSIHAGCVCFMIGRVTDKADGMKYSCGEMVRQVILPADGIVKPESIALNKKSFTLENGQSTTLLASVRPVDAENKELQWSSSNPTIATVDSAGTITTHAIGKTTITATVKGTALTASCELEVLIPFCATDSVTLSETELKFHLGEKGTRQLVATVLPHNATNQVVKWSVTDSKVLTVDAEGRITAQKAGTTIVVAQVENTKLRATCKVTVLPPYVEVTGVRVSYADQVRRLAVGKKDRLYGYTDPVNATNRDFTWTSSNPNVVVVTSYDGYADVTAIGKGEAEIVLGIASKNFTSSVKYTVTGATLEEKCDVNADGVVNILDVVYAAKNVGVVDVLEKPDVLDLLDITEDDQLDCLDLDYIAKSIR